MEPDLTKPLRVLQDRLSRRLRELGEEGRNGRALDLAQLFLPSSDPAALLTQIDQLKRCLDSFRPLTPAEAQHLASAFDVEYTFESNRIEGNSLTLAETHVVLAHGVTVAGKPLLHHLEAVNHRDALAWVKGLVTEGVPLSPSVILEINRIILKGSMYEAESGRFRTRRVSISGSRHVPPNYIVVPDQVALLFNHLAVWQAEGRHPVEIAAHLHFELVRIHPFVDGNGRTARLVMSFWLLQAGYVIANLSGEPESRIRYYDALEAASVESNLIPFYLLVYERAKASLIWHLDGLTPDVEAGRGLFFLDTIAPLL
jgi:Fic family protein